ncbi:MAG: hypothetical protein ABR608_09090 [Pseudonocardiaceae bacterium]
MTAAARERAMVLRWRYEGYDGALVPGPEVSFEDQADAEEWLGGAWPGLLAGGVERVTLLDGVREIYGPMSLRPS